jgi:amino acid adenylation domain-containing protein
MVGHANVVRLMEATESWFGFGPEDVWTLFHSYAFDFSVWELWGALAYGGRLIVVPRVISRSPEELRDLLRRDGVTVLNQTPSAFRQLIAAGNGRAGQHNLRCVIFGGEALDVGMLKPWYERKENHPTRLINMYGITETTVHVTYRLLEPVDTQRGGGSPIGRRIPDLKTYILDAQSQPAPVGVKGELHIGGAGVARGYLNRPEMTAERFQPDPYGEEAGARVYKTGDLGRWLSDGEIEFVGRNDSQVKIRGYRIELGEIEARLAEHSGVKDAVVIVGEDGEGGNRLIAYYTGEKVGVESLRAHLAATLPEYMRPSAYAHLEKMPLTQNGKLDRRALPAPDMRDAERVDGDLAPQTPVEEIVTGIFEDTLKLGRVGRKDNFFELGGHSLLATQVHSRIRKMLGVDIGVRSVFEGGTAEELSRKIEEAMKAGKRDEAPPLIKVSREEKTPLSFAQQRLWFIDQLDPGKAVYNMPGAMRLKGVLDLDALERSVNEIFRRHEVLRTSIEVEDGEPTQVIDAWAQRRLEVVDLTNSTLERRKEEAGRIAREEAETGFDLSRGPMLRVKVLKLEEYEHVLLYTMHHIVSDEWSMGILIGEVETLYQSYLEGKESPLPELEIQYADFAVWQRKYLAGEVLEKEVGYWRKQLKDAAVLELPADLPRPAEPSYRGNWKMIWLDRGLSEDLRKLSRREGATLFMTLMAAFKILLMKYSGQEDVSVGTVIANRTRKEMEGLIGFFVNTLVMRTDLSGNPSFREMIRREREVALGAYAHQDLPFEKLVEELNPERDLSRNSLFQIMVTMQNVGRETLAPSGVNFSGDSDALETGGETQSAKFDLRVSLVDLGQKLAGIVEYSQDLFEAETINRLINHFTNALDGVVKDCERRISDLSLLSEGEWKQIVEEWNATDADYPREKRIHELFEEQAEKSSHVIALVHEDQRLTYAELNARANRIARFLIDQGAEPGSNIAILLDRSIDMVCAQLAALKCGAAFVALDRYAPIERQTFIIEDCKAGILLTDNGQRLVEVDGVNRFNIEDLRLSEYPSTNLAIPWRRDAAFYIMYTSGSTGQPKGVITPHRAIGRLALNNGWANLSSGDRFAYMSNPAWDASTMEVWPPLLNGACVVVIDQPVALAPEELKQRLQAQDVNAIWFTVGLFNQYADILAETLQQFSYLLVGGDALDPRIIARVLRDNPPKRLINGYGPTETTVFATTYEIAEVQDDAKSIPIGRPISNTSIYILDAFYQPVPVGVKGEIYIGGAGVALGYLNRPDLTAERFLADPFSSAPGTQMYKSGDLGQYLPDGRIDFRGRNDFQLKIRGFRIELGEIEAHLGSHPAVRQCVVVAHKDDGTEKRLVAYLVSECETAPSDQELRDYLAERLPEYMLPWRFVRLDQMPLTPNGKVDRRALPGPALPGAIVRYEAPIGATEMALARIWAEVLKLERVGREDNFFELGGHSMVAITVMDRMRREGMQADVRWLFMTPTLRGLAETITWRAGEGQAPPRLIPAGCKRITPEMLPLIALAQPEIDAIAAITPGGAANIQDIYPLTALQEGILFHHLMSEEGDAYLLSSLLAFDTRERLERFVWALQSVVARHDILRTAVVWEGLSEPVQMVWRDAPMTVEEVSLNPEDDDVARRLQERFNPRSYRLDLRQAPLMRGFAAYDGIRERWLLLCLNHHLTIDHMTLEIMMREAQAHLSGESERLPEPLPFRNLVAQARLGIGREEHEAFFREMLGDVDEPTAPFGLTDAQGDGSGIEEARLDLEMGLSRRLRERARMLGVSVASLCHLAWAMTLARVSAPLSGRDDVVFGTVLFGRMQGVVGVGQTLGLFINTLPIRIRIDDEGVALSAKRTHRLLVELIAHEHTSLALAQRCSGVEAPAPLFSALLNYRHSLRQTEVADTETVSAWTGVNLLSSDERTNYPLTLSVEDLGEGLALTAQTVRAVDPRRVNELMLTALTRLADALENEPQKAVRAIDIMPEAERGLLLEEWNATEAAYPKEKLIHELFEEQVEKSSNAIALVCEEKNLTYSELNVSANRLAWRLRELGAGPEARVAICLERGLEMVVAMLATLKAGAAYAPLDPDYPAARLAYMLEDSAPAVLLTKGAAREALAAQTHGVCVVDLEADGAQWACHSDANPNRAGVGMNARSLAYILYTSGSTGLPKGVAIEHRSVVNFICWAKSAFDPEALERTLFSTSINFDLAVYECYAPLTSGATITIVGNALDLGRSPEDVTLVNTVPSAMKTLVETSGVPKSVRTVNLAGEPLRQELVEGIFAGTGVERVCNLYGPSETTTYSTWVSMKRGESFAPHIGHPIANTRIYILDGALEPSLVGVSGEIHIGGAGEARGYLNRPEMTAERFLPDAFSREPGARVYKTGDLGRWLSGGVIEFQGRNDLQVKIRGYRIELGEIEARLRSHPGVTDAVVIAHEENGSGKRLVAYYTGEDIGTEALRSYLVRALPEYMAPSAYAHLEKLPLTPNGKLDRRALPSPNLTRVEEGDGYLAPRTPVEEIVVGIFQETLKQDRVGRRESFFDLGGHSLLATQVISRVRNSFEVEMGVRSVFEAPTAEGLATKIEEAMKAGEKAPIPQLVRASRKERMPLSFAQQRLWFLDQLIPNNPLYNIPGFARLNGGLNLDALERAINEIVRRHEVLRTRIEMEAGEPAQVIDEWTPWRLEVLDLRSFSLEEKEAEVSRIAREEAGTGFDLSRGPLLKVRVLKLDEEEYLVFYTMHHIVSDGWSMGVLIREVDTLYRSYSAEEESPLPELEIQYADFAVWQREYLTGEVLENEVGYWREHLKDAAVLELPTDLQRPPEPSYRGSYKTAGLGQRLSEDLKTLSRREGATLFMTLMAAFKVLLMRYGGQEDISVGTVIANRTRKEVEKLIGFFVNTLVMRTDLSGNPSFRGMVRREREVALGAYAHQDLPFEKLVEELNPARDLSFSPLFQVMLVMQNAGQEILKPKSVEPEGLSSGLRNTDDEHVAHFDLTLTVMDLGHELALTVEYSRDLFESGTVERLINHYTNLLDGAASNGEARISELSLLSAEEKEEVIVGWNETTSPYPEDRCAHHLFERRVELTPEAVAVVSDQGCLSYGELNRRGNRLAHHLRGRGVRPESVIGVCLERSLEIAVGLLGALKAGGACLPLDPMYPPERLRFMLEDSSARLIVTQEDLKDLFVDSPSALVSVDGSRDEIARESEENIDGVASVENLAYVIYTSGSTGVPKAAMITHRSVVSLATDAVTKFRLGPKSRFLQFASLSFDVAVEEIYPVWISGGSVALLMDEEAYSYSELTKTIEKHEVTTVELPTAYWREWMRELLRSGRRAPRCLDLVITGDERITVDVFRKWTEHDVSLLHVYGVTECTVNSIVYEVPADFGERGKPPTIPIGKPIANTEVYILDKGLEPTPLRIPGELYLGGVGVSRGYLKRPDLTAERFAPSPFSKKAGGRLYRSGDLARSYEAGQPGRIEFIGRTDTQVKLRGYRIELGEIEAQLRRYPGIREAVAQVREDNAGDKRLVAYYTIAATDGSVTRIEEEPLRAYLSTVLPGYMLPGAYVELEALPLTPNGKLDRRALPQPGWAGAAINYEAPVGDIEVTLAQIWAEELQLPQVGRHDNFFTLGGHSLLAIRLIERMRSAGLQIDVRALFITPTIAGLAEGMEKTKEIIL